MSLNQTRGSIEQYFATNWTETPINYEGQFIERDDDHISLKFVPIANNQLGFDGTSTGRIEVLGNMQVFTYSTNPPKVYILADKVIAFLSGVDVASDIRCEYGQVVSSAVKHPDGLYELMVSFTVRNFS